MTRILHTADLHLAEDHPERWDALEALLAAARERAIDALLVAGDLLDRAGEAAALRPRIRAAFESLDASVLLLPGNHDRSAFRPGQDWGPRTTLLLGEPVHEATVGSARILGVPFPAREVGFAHVRRDVEERLAGGAEDRHAGDGSGPAIVVLHGTLIDASAPEIQDESRADEAGPYFPIRSEELLGLDADYVALGHYHQYALRRLGGVPVAYAGSPSPVGPHAVGPRTAVLVEGGAGGVELQTVDLPVEWRARRERWLTPFEEREGLDALSTELEEAADPLCHMRVRVDGILAGMSEAEVREAADRLQERLASAYAGLRVELASVGLDPARADLFRDFRRRLETRLAEDRARGRERSEAVARRALELGARALKS